MNRTVIDNMPSGPNLGIAEGSWNRFLDTRGGKAAASIIAMLALASACSATPETSPTNTPSITETTTSTGLQPTTDAAFESPEIVRLPSLEEGEALTETERINICKELMPKYGFVSNIDLGPNAPADRILSLRLSLRQAAYRESEPRLLWCVYPIEGTGYERSRDEILNGEQPYIPGGWYSLEELSREDPEHVELRWSFKSLDGSTSVSEGEFRYADGIYLPEKISSVLNAANS